jgi:hypothetical protein
VHDRKYAGLTPQAFAKRERLVSALPTSALQTSALSPSASPPSGWPLAPAALNSTTFGLALERRGNLGGVRPALEFSVSQSRDEAAQPLAVA